MAFYLPMHTATRLAIPVIRRTRESIPAAHLCAYGLYAPMNADLLRKLGVETVAGGEFEEPLLTLVRPGAAPLISLARQRFAGAGAGRFSGSGQYAQLVMPGGERRTVGYTEASRGMQALCRHCPVVPVYQGQFRVVQRDIVMEDIRRQVAAGAQHITFGDPDFFNGSATPRSWCGRSAREFPGVSYDATIKVEHLLRHCAHLPLLRETGCAFVVSAVESVDDDVLRHILERVILAPISCGWRECFAMRAGAGADVRCLPSVDHAGRIRDLLATIAGLDLVEHVSPVQLSIRLLVPAGSRLLELAEAQAAMGEFDEEALSYRWVHRDPRVDRLQRDLEATIARAVTAKEDRRTIFRRAWEMGMGRWGRRRRRCRMCRWGVRG